MSTEIGFIGLGTMGSRIAGRLLDAGHHIYGTNRTAAKAGPLIERGLIWLDTPREVAAAAGVVISMVTDDNALEAIAAELLLLGWRRHTFFNTSFIRSFISVTVGGAIIAGLSAALGVLAAG